MGNGAVQQRKRERCGEYGSSQRVAATCTIVLYTQRLKQFAILLSWCGDGAAARNGNGLTLRSSGLQEQCGCNSE